MSIYRHNILCLEHNVVIGNDAVLLENGFPNDDGWAIKGEAVYSSLVNCLHHIQFLAKVSV